MTCRLRSIGSGLADSCVMPAPLSLDTIRSLPKVLLHDHLDGGLRPSTVIELADACGWTLPTTDEAELQTWFTAGAATNDLHQYLATFEHTVGVLQTADALRRVAEEAVADLVADGVVYAELRFAPELHQQRGLALAEIVEAVADGIRAGERAAAAAGTPIIVHVIVCAMRMGNRSLEIVQFLERMRFKEPKLVAFDLAGGETGFPPSKHAEALDLARRKLLNITLHASEAPDVELVEDALGQGAHRIGHGLRLASGMLRTPNGQAILGQVARFVYDHRIHLEMAPSCNVQIGAVPDIASHPITDFLRLGFSVGVNTDNRLVSGVTLSGELHLVATTFELSVAEVELLVTNALESSFLALETRKRLLDTVVRPAFAAAAR